MLFIYCSNSTDVRVVIPSVDNWFTPTLAVFGSIHLIFALWMAIEYFLLKKPNFVFADIWFSKNRFAVFFRR